MATTEEKESPLAIIQPSDGSALTEAIQSSSWGDEDDEVFPEYVKIRQVKSLDMEEFTLGNFACKANGTEWSTLTLVPLGVRLGRKFQSKYVPGKVSEVYCRSTNRVTPVTTDDRFTPKSNSCKTCKYGQLAWRDYKTTKEKPVNFCEEEVDFLFIEASNPTQPYIYATNSREGREVLEVIYDKIKKRSKIVQSKTGVRPELYNYEITLKTKKGTGQYNSEFWYPTLEGGGIKELSAEIAKEKYGDAYEVFVRLRKEAYAAAQEASKEQTEENEAASGTQTVKETPAETAPAPKDFTPPPSRRKAGSAVKPTYTPPATATIDAKIDVQESTPVDAYNDEVLP